MVFSSGAKNVLAFCADGGNMKVETPLNPNYLDNLEQGYLIIRLCPTNFPTVCLFIPI